MNEEQEVIAYSKISELTSYQAEIVSILHKTVAKGTTTSELAYFLSVCKSLDLNPLNKEIWCYKDNVGNLLVFTGRDGFLVKAQRHPDYGGMRSCEVCENDTFSLDVANNVIEHKFGVEKRGNVIGAYSIVFRKGCEPTIEWANISDFDKNKNTWTKFQADMIKKVAECHALKKAFGISNLVSEYDFEIKNNIAYAGGYDNGDQKLISKPLPQDKSAERVIALLKSAKTRKELEKFLKDCKTEEQRNCYDEQYQLLK